MISEPFCGWCDFKLGYFDGRLSYITDVPVDLLSAFINYRESGAGAAYLDGEQYGKFTFVLSYQAAYIIEDKEDSILHVFRDIDLNDLEKELMLDIYENIKRWSSSFWVEGDPTCIIENKLRYMNLLEKLEEIRTKTYGLEPVLAAKEEEKEEER